MYFGRCIAFFEDANNQIFIGVRWYEAADGSNSLIDPIVHLAKLKLSPANNSRSSVRILCPVPNPYELLNCSSCSQH